MGGDPGRQAKICALLVAVAGAAVDIGVADDRTPAVEGDGLLAEGKRQAPLGDLRTQTEIASSATSGGKNANSSRRVSR